MRKLFAMLLVFATMIGVVDVERSMAQAVAGARPKERAHDSSRINWGDYPEVSPFQGVRWRGLTPEVMVNGTWYELVNRRFARARNR
jgi:hypothetical protein